METTDLSLPDYWEDVRPDVRFNPVGSAIQQGMMDFVNAESRLAGHVLVATSGSSGEPKWIALSKRALVASASSVNAHLSAAQNDRWLCALPPFHVGGIGVFARAFAEGIPALTFDGRWRGRAEEFATLCETERITLTSLTPTQVHDLVTEQIHCPASLRAVIVGGGRLDKVTGQAARDLGWPVLASYGMTEASSQIATETLDALANPFVGDWLPVLEGWEVSEKSGIRGPALFSGTVAESKNGGWQFNPASVDEEGWFQTADRVQLRQGRNQRPELCFLGRSDDLVKRLGELVSMNGLRERLATATRRHDLSGTVIALPDARSGARFVAVFERIGRDDQRAQESVNACNVAGAPFERIDEIRFVPNLPRTELGKIAYSLLSKQLRYSEDRG